MSNFFVAQADVGPVVRELLELVGVEAGVALVALQRRDDGVEGQLARDEGHRGDRGVDDVDARLGCHEDGRDLVAADVVRVQMDRHADLVFEGRHELLCGVGLEEAGHVLDGDHVRAALFELLGGSDVIFERVLVARRIEGCHRYSRWSARRFCPA